MTSPQGTARWWNWLALWLIEHDPVHEWIYGLAIPAMVAKAEAEHAEMQDPGFQYDGYPNDDAYRRGHEDGFAEAESERPF